MGLIKMFAAAALGVAVLVGQPSPAEAAVRLANGASASATINCSQSMGWVRTTVNLQPRSRLSKQTVAFRQFIAPIDGSAGIWTGWTTRTAPFSATFVTNLTNANFHVYMQYAWLQNGNWTYAGEWIQTYGQVQGFATYNYSYCAV